MDLLVELFKNEDKIFEGTALNQRVLGSSTSDQSRKYTVALTQLPAYIEFDADDMLGCRVWVRRNGGSDEYPLKLWYNGDPSTGGGLKSFSRIHKQSGYYYLCSGNDLSTDPGSSALSESLTTSADYQLFGEWSMPGSALKRAAGNFTMSLPTNLRVSLVPTGNSKTLHVTESNEGMLSVTIYDITGRIVRSYTPVSVKAGTDHQLTIGHEGLSAGVYTVMIENGTARASLRFPVIQ